MKNYVLKIKGKESRSVVRVDSYNYGTRLHGRLEKALPKDVAANIQELIQGLWRDYLEFAFSREEANRIDEIHATNFAEHGHQSIEIEPCSLSSYLVIEPNITRYKKTGAIEEVELRLRMDLERLKKDVLEGEFFSQKNVDWDTIPIVEPVVNYIDDDDVEM